MARLVTVTGGLALVAVLLTGCGGGSDDRTKVEDSLRHYISGMHPEEGAFPTDAGPPRVQDKSCKDRHVTTKRGQVHTIHSATKRLPAGFALWSCIVTFRNSLTLPVRVAVNGSEVVAVVAIFPGASPNVPRQSPARTYTG
jgi:hypothetical protein